MNVEFTSDSKKNANTNSTKEASNEKKHNPYVVDMFIRHKN